MKTCIIVAVDYPVVEQTITYNRHHFDKVCVVTAERDIQTQFLLNNLNVPFYATDAFYRNGAFFNKWLALEEGLDYFGRYGWLWIMDADIFLPKQLPPNISFIPENLYTPHRRMSDGFITESMWSEQRYPTNMRDFNGYCHIFHSLDSHLPNPTPWYETDWIHAGGADTFFQARWEPDHKIRPDFEVLHVGHPAYNWCGVGKHRELQLLRSIKDPEYKHEKLQLPTSTPSLSKEH